jgi:SNF2 family DNA or RNA helicase
VICGLDTARGHASDLNHLDFTTVIIDECHRVKNPRAATTIAMHSFETKIRFGLTVRPKGPNAGFVPRRDAQGTAMQNRYGEMWTILDWAFPRRLGSAADWKAWVEVPISKAQKHNSSTADLAIGRVRPYSLSDREDSLCGPAGTCHRSRHKPLAQLLLAAVSSFVMAKCSR